MATNFARGSELAARSRKFKNKKILITAGPTWVPIDKVRVISNIASGATGLLLADALCSLGAKVTLLLGPANYCCLNKKIHIVRFAFFDELKSFLIKELKQNRFDYIIHSAAVSDFKAAKPTKGKLASGKALNLKLLPLPKLAKGIRNLQPQSTLVLFKLESGIRDAALIKRARNSLIKYKADLVIANRIDPRYKAFILNEDTIFCKVNSKQTLVKSLIRAL